MHLKINRDITKGCLCQLGSYSQCALLSLEMVSRQSNRKCQATITEQQTCLMPVESRCQRVKYGNKSQAYCLCLSKRQIQQVSVIFHPKSGGGHI